MEAGNGLFDEAPRDYDAVLVVSFGGPEGPHDVMPFLHNVLRGRGASEAAKARVAQRYRRFRGVSPINAHTRAFAQALEASLKAAGRPLPVYLGNRNWHPFLGDAVRGMVAAGVRRALAFVTSVFGSYSGCRQYREDLHRAVQPLDAPPRIDKLRLAWNHPGFIAATAARLAAALQEAPDAPVLFTAHSLPTAMAAGARYEAQLAEACALVAEAAKAKRWRLAYQSASAGAVPWLQPDVDGALAGIAAQGAATVVVAPIGFVCDHMEVVHDLDIDLRSTATGLGLKMIRAATVGSHPAYVGMVRDLIFERMAASPERPFLGNAGPAPDYCPASCCPSGRPGASLPALCGAAGDAPAQP